MNNPKAIRTHEVAWWKAALLLRGQTPTDQRNIQVFTTWCFIWAVAFVGVSIALKAYPGLRGPLAWLLALVPIVLGAIAIRALLRFLREADEFTRKVQLEGIAWGFGAGHLFCIGYYFLERFGAPQISVINVMVALALGWAVGSLLVAARYR